LPSRWLFRCGQGGFGLANTASSALNCLLLLFALRKKLKTLDFASLRPTFVPLAVATALAGLTAWWGWRLWESRIGHDALPANIGAVFVPATARADLFTVTLALKVPAAKEITDLVFQKIPRGAATVKLRPKRSDWTRKG